MPHNPEDDWTRPVPRSPRRGGDDGRTRPIRRDESYDDAYDRHDDGYDDGYVPPARGYYDENGDWVPRARPGGRSEAYEGAYQGYAEDDRYDPYEGRDRYDDRERYDEGRRQAAAGGPPPGRPARPRTAPGGRPPRRRARYGVRRFLALLALLLLAYVVTMAVVVALVWGSVDRVDATPEAADRPTGGSGTAYLLVGTDRVKAGEGNGSDATEGSRADTVMLLHVPTVGEPTLVSLPRDSYLPIRDQGYNKLNAAHSSGGPALLVDTVEQATGIPIEGFMGIGFDGFTGVVEEVGGVHMCLDAPVQDSYAHIDLQAGCQDLTGEEALGYVRMRYSDPRGDLGRVERQRQFLAALVDRMLSPATVLNPVRLHSVGTATGEALTLGEDTSFVEAGRMALAMRTIAGGGGNSLTVPVADTNYPTAVGSTVLWDEQGAAELFAALREGRTVTVEP